MPTLEIAGLRTFYVDEGSGPPVVLLHGGLSSSDAWAEWIPQLAKNRRVLAPDRRGHGRTADTDAPFSYVLMALETILFCDQVIGGPVDLVGWSDGAVVAALVALDRPDLVRTTVLIGQYFSMEGQEPGTVQMLTRVTDTAPASLREEYEALSPDGADHFDAVLAKSAHLWRHEPELSMATLSAITSPTLVLQGDHDLVRLEHSAELARTLPHGRLAVLPGTHMLPVERPELVRALVEDFIDESADDGTPG